MKANAHYIMRGFNVISWAVKITSFFFPHVHIYISWKLTQCSSEHLNLDAMPS